MPVSRRSRIAVAEQRGDHRAVEIARDSRLRRAQVGIPVQAQHAGAGQPATTPAVLLQSPPTSTGIRPPAIAWPVAAAASRQARMTASRLRVQLDATCPGRRCALAR